MRNAPANLRDCSQFRQTLLARPPAVVHGTAILLLLLLTIVLVWSNLTQANLVVRAPGQVRPENRVFQVFVPEGVDRPGYRVSGQVQEVHYREGHTVVKGQILLRLNTRLLEEEQVRLQLTLRTCQAELNRFEEQVDLLSGQFEVALAQANAELLRAEEELQRARRKQAIELARDAAEYRHALLNLQRLEQLRTTRAVAEPEVDAAKLKLRQAQANLDLARQPILERGVESRRREVQLVEKNYALRCKELETEQTKKQAECERAKTELATLESRRERAVLRSPIDGIVTTKEVKVGDILERGKPIVDVVQQGSLHFEATVSNREASHLREGMPVRVKLDAYDQQWYGVLPGKVVFISPDSRVVADGKGQPVGYEVRIALDHDELRRGDLRGQVKLGLTGTAEIITDRKSIFSILRKNIRRSVSLG